MNSSRTYVALISLLLSKAAFCLGLADAENYNAFVKSFRQNINYPVELARNCKPSFCLLKVVVDPDQKITDMSLSDSADSLLKKEFDTHKQDLKVNFLESYIVRQYAKAGVRNFLIPVSFGFHQMPCGTQAVELTSLHHYFRFENKDITGKVIMLPAIGSLQHTQR